MPRTIGLRADIELRNQVSPAEQLAAQRRAPLNTDGEIRQMQDALVAIVPVAAIFMVQHLGGSIHLVANHEDLQGATAEEQIGNSIVGRQSRSGISQSTVIPRASATTLLPEHPDPRRSKSI